MLIEYNGVTIDTGAARTATLNCREKKMKTNVSVVFDSDGVIVYDGKQRFCRQGFTASMSCGRKRALTDIVIVRSVSEIADTWEEISQSISDGTYRSKYFLGDSKTITLSTGENVQMQIVAFDADDKADGSGKAAITWLSKDCVGKSPYKYESSDTPANWTDGVSAWGNDIKTYVETTLYARLPENIQSMITSVKKTYTTSRWAIYGIEHPSTEKTMKAKTWIPSKREVMGSGEESGCVYTDFFTTYIGRRKNYNGEAQKWWTRSGDGGDYSKGTFYFINEDGFIDDLYHRANLGIALGFCT